MAKKGLDAYFMAISGYLAFWSGGGKNALDTLYRRFRQLVIPFSLWSLITLVIHQDITLNTIISIFLYPDSGLWFLWVLFWINVFFVLGSWFAELMKVKQEYVVITMCALFAAVMVFFDIRVLGFQFIAYYLLFYSLGFYLNKYQDKVHFLNNRWATLVLFVLWFALAWNWKMHELPPFLQQIPLPGSILQYFYRFMTAAIAVFLLVIISPKRLNVESKWNTPFVRLGYYSLGIYAVHSILLGIIVDLLVGFGINPYWIIIASFTIAVSLSWMIVWLLSKWKVTATLLLGKI